MYFTLSSPTVFSLSLWKPRNLLLAPVCSDLSDMLAHAIVAEVNKKHGSSRDMRCNCSEKIRFLV
jgi:hypothetical protein